MPSLYEVKTQLSRYVREAEEGRPVVITRHNEAVAVLVPFNGYATSMNTARTAEQVELLQRIAEEAQKVANDAARLLELEKQASAQVLEQNVGSE